MTELAAAMNSFERKIRFKYLSPPPQTGLCGHFGQFQSG